MENEKLKKSVHYWVALISLNEKKWCAKIYLVKKPGSQKNPILWQLRTIKPDLHWTSNKTVAIRAVASAWLLAWHERSWLFRSLVMAAASTLMFDVVLFLGSSSSVEPVKDAQLLDCKWSCKSPQKLPW